MTLDGRTTLAELGIVDPTIVPALYEHACRVYKAMEEQATWSTLEGVDSDRQFLLYEGHLTNLFRKLLLSVPYYTKIRNMLIALGCIEQVRRGGGNGTSKWVLWHAPALDAWKEVEARKPARGNTKTVQEQQIKDLNTRVAVLEQRMEVLIKALVSTETQERLGV